jgi:hypothetical protein
MLFTVANALVVLSEVLSEVCFATAPIYQIQALYGPIKEDRLKGIWKFSGLAST